MCGAVQRSFAVGHSALLVDLRCHGRSDGHIITFGLRESEDVPLWIEEVRRRFGADHPVMISGVSMGAATVMMAAGRPLPENVVGVLADCGYTSPKEIIQKVTVDMKLPPKLAWPFIKLGAKLFGRFDLEETSPIEAMKVCTLPVIFAHGEADDFVPCDMSRRNYEACAAPKRLITVPGAGHGLAYPADPDSYLNALAEGFTAVGIPTKVIAKETVKES